MYLIKLITIIVGLSVGLFTLAFGLFLWYASGPGNIETKLQILGTFGPVALLFPLSLLLIFTNKVRRYI